MINEVFENYIITYSLKGYWENATITIVEIWPRSGPTTVDIDVPARFGRRFA